MFLFCYRAYVCSGASRFIYCVCTLYPGEPRGWDFIPPNPRGRTLWTGVASLIWLQQVEVWNLGKDHQVYRLTTPHNTDTRASAQLHWLRQHSLGLHRENRLINPRRHMFNGSFIHQPIPWRRRESSRTDYSACSALGADWARVN